MNITKLKQLLSELPFSAEQAAEVQRILASVEADSVSLEDKQRLLELIDAVTAETKELKAVFQESAEVLADLATKLQSAEV